MIVRNKSNFTHLLLLILIEVICAQEKYYESKYDYYDVDSLIQNPRLLQKYLDCFLEKGPCTPVGRVFRRKY